MTNVNQRSRQLKIALATLFAAAALLASPRIAQQVYAQDSMPSCSANCARGSCSGTGTCTCTCSYWTGLPLCSCYQKTQT
jgi:hypothetical protein